MSQTSRLKIAGCAFCIPAVLGVGWALHSIFHHAAAAPPPPEQQLEEPKPDPHLTIKPLQNARHYVLPYGYPDLFVFTDPGNPGQHCISKWAVGAEFKCYPTAHDLKIENESHPDLTVYVINKENNIQVQKFDDPENPALYCLGNFQGNFTCYPKPLPQPK